MTLSRTWPFEVGELVESRDDYGPLICDLSIRAKREPHARYVVVGLGDGGRWLLLKDPYDPDRFYGGSRLLGWGRPAPAIGGGYFRIVGPCGIHYPAYSTDAGMFICGRCDQATPEHVSHYWMREAGWTG